MRVAILTGGGDCPGLNAVIRAVTRACVSGYGCDVVGVRNGWRGLIDGEVVHLDLERVSGILPLGGTILGTSRTNPFNEPLGPERILRTIRDDAIDAVVAIGGEDTLGVALRLGDEHGVKLVGIPKTIDNDLSGTDYTFGFDTAVHVASQAIDRLHTTAESHNRVMVVEVMGRHAGWIAVMAGIAGGADAIVIPEFPLTVEDVCDLVERRAGRGKRFSIIVVSEGASLLWRSGIEQTVTMSAETDAFGHVRLGGVGSVLAREIEEITGYETRVTILGHVQRGGTPTAHDRVLATRFGIKAAAMVQEGAWGMMAALKGDSIEAIPLAEAVREYKLVPRELWELARTFFG
ncbi:MAG: 6-phosphofructokinase [Thermoleophilia bacterium]|nr:6-phosphofructokinase [Thermoleophilia bacterium]